MNSVKPLQWAAIVLGMGVFLYFSHLPYWQYLSDVSFLGGVILLEAIIAGVWKYDQRFFPLLMIAFIWAGVLVPGQGAFRGGGRWIVLFAGAFAGFVIWTRTPRRPFGSLHLIAFFCVCAAFVSATVSPWIQMASLKAFSLFLLFLYCASGARLAILGREGRFFRGLLWGCEIVVYSTAICYFGLGQSIWGNPNSLGAAFAIAVFPLLLWGWFISGEPGVKFRRLAALLLCTYLIFFSGARAGIVSAGLVAVIFCVCLRQYRLLVKVTAFALVMVAIAGVLDPSALNKRLGDLTDTLLYKGHKEEGLLGSRRTPWEKTKASIKEHPWFGTGYGTSPTGEDPGSNFGIIASSAETAREHGSSYMTIADWVGLLGVLPFIAILSVTALNVWKVCGWMRRTSDPYHYSIPLAMVLLSGLVHAGFEDWLFAVGSYLCVFFWTIAFLLADFVPAADVVPVAGIVSRPYHPPTAGFGTVVSNR
jgi:O-antigen ligase